MSFEPNEIVNDFRICKYIDKGAVAQVYKLKDLATGEKFAGKIVKKKNYNESEIDIHKSLNHENILKFYKTFEYDGYVFIILELCEEELYKLINVERIKFSVQRVKKCAKELLFALSYLHTNKIMHRDVKLENLLLKDDVLKLCDFGLSIRFEGRGPYGFSGTLNYLSPEILTYLYDERTDIWSFGIVLFEMLFDGRTPFNDDDKYETMQLIKRIEYRFPTIYSLSDQEFEKYSNIIRQILVKDVERLSIKEIIKFMND